MKTRFFSIMFSLILRDVKLFFTSFRFVIFLNSLTITTNGKETRYADYFVVSLTLLTFTARQIRYTKHDARFPKKLYALQ